MKCLVKCSTIYNQYFWDLFLVLGTVSDVSVTFYGHVNLNEELLCSIFGHISQHFWNYQLCLKSNFWTTISFCWKIAKSLFWIFVQKTKFTWIFAYEKSLFDKENLPQFQRFSSHHIAQITVFTLLTSTSFILSKVTVYLSK